ncbi:MAG TPA: EamA family transporter [Gemmatimonadales bacterium]|nr:EamA family transporter [Gemmatimonadales bacterium]
MGTAWKKGLAYAVIYLVWGSTFLAIRICVQEVPPFLCASIRFLLAGALLWGWTLARRERQPRGRERLTTVVVAFLIFVLDYGLVFWAERKVPSGIAAVMLATIPLFMAISEILVLRERRLTLRLAIALLMGITGVAVLTSRTLGLGGTPVPRAEAVGLIIGAMSWAVASVLTRRLPLPASKVVTSGSQMFVGGVLLSLIAAGLGEARAFDPSTVSPKAWLALAYLIVPGSIVAFTAYTWLIQVDSPTRVGTYAYVNPIVAVLLGYFAGGEDLSLRTVLGSLLVLVSVVVIMAESRGKGLTSRPRTSPSASAPSGTAR